MEDVARRYYQKSIHLKVTNEVYATQPEVSTVERPQCNVDAIRPLLIIPSDLKLQWTHEILHSRLGFH